MIEISQTERVTDEELDQMIWKLERDGMTPKMLSLMRELRAWRKAAAEPVADVVAWHKEGEERTCDIRWRRFDVAPGSLYTAPPAPGVLNTEKLNQPVSETNKDE